MWIKKLKTVILLILIVSSLSCTRVILVRLELPKQPSNNDNTSNGIKVFQGSQDFTVNTKLITEIIKTTH